MYGDFTRLTHDPRKHYLRVLMQQGRVQLDADWNEQASILLRYLQMLAADLIGPFGGPGDGFKIVPQPGPGGSIPEAFILRPGHYYVDGILAENDADLHYGNAAGNQLPFPTPEPENNQQTDFLALVLDVFEQHVSHLQDAGIREVALGGPDTATRSKVAWRVRAWKIEPDEDEQKDLRCFLAKSWETLVAERQPANRGQLRARAQGDVDPKTDPCIASPEASFRGTENQLYRVEIHRGGQALAPGVGEEKAATFKWSRDNGSEEYRLLRFEGKTAFLESLGRDDRTRLHEGDWLELVDDLSGGLLSLLPLFQVVSVDTRRDAVVLKAAPPGLDEDAARQRHAFLRRWHHREGKLSQGAVLLTEGTADPEKGWLTLEDGVQIRFEPGGAGTPVVYRPGDFWLIPARTATGDVEWPRDGNGPVALPPNGVEHHLAPLAALAFPDDAAKLEITDCRTVFQPLGCPTAIDLSTGRADWRVTAVPPPLPPPPEPPEPPVHVKTLAVNWMISLGLTWVSAIETPEAKGPGGIYVYELHFCLDACLLRRPRLELSLVADDSVEVLLNDTPIGDKGRPAFGAPPLVIVKTDTALFRLGDNVLQVKVTNDPADTPTGFALSGVVTSA